MRKRILKWVSGIIACVVLACAIIPFSACGFDNAVKKASKNLTNYTITATFDDQEKTLSVNEKVSFLNTTGQDLNEVMFHIYPRAFTEGATIKPYTELTKARCFPNGENFGDIVILGVRAQGESVALCFDGEDDNVLKVGLKKSLENGKRTEFEFDFMLTLAECQHRLGYFENNVNLGNWYLIACEFENGDFDKTPYYATGDPFNSACANYFIDFTCSSDYTLASSGTIKSSTQNGNATKYKLEGRAIRDFALTLGKNFSKATDKVGDTTINYFGYAGDLDIDANLKLACRAVMFFNETFGKYPYRVLNVVKTPFMHGGMEYPNFVTVSDCITQTEEVNKVIVHEIAHQWWYGLCGNNEVTDAWFDEGLSEYSTFLFFQKYPALCQSYDDLIKEAQMGYNLYLEVFDAIDIEVIKRMDLAVNEYSNEYEYTYMVYVKGALMFDAISKQIGAKQLNKSLKKLVKKYRFKKVGKKEFEEILPSKARAIFNGFVDGSIEP